MKISGVVKNVTAVATAVLCLSSVPAFAVTKTSVALTQIASTQAGGNITALSTSSGGFFSASIALLLALLLSFPAFLPFLRPLLAQLQNLNGGGNVTYKK